MSAETEKVIKKFWANIKGYKSDCTGGAEVWYDYKADTIFISVGFDCLEKFSEEFIPNCDWEFSGFLTWNGFTFDAWEILSGYGIRDIKKEVWEHKDNPFRSE